MMNVEYAKVSNYDRPGGHLEKRITDLRNNGYYMSPDAKLPLVKPLRSPYVEPTQPTPVATSIDTSQPVGVPWLKGGSEYSPASSDYFANPITNVAVQYGAKLMGTGKQMVDKEINRYIKFPLLKLYFMINNDYVFNKIRLVLFPFVNKDWSLKYAENCRIGPKYDVNSPDLYIPLMAYLTYVLIAGIIMGINDMFQPESLMIIASQALAWTVVEIIFQLIIIYFTNITVTLTTIDISAYSGYKFIGINIMIIIGVLINNTAYWLSLLYCCISMGYFTVQTLKWRLMTECQEYTGHIEYKRKTYFLVVLALNHVLQMWWLSSNLLKRN